MKKQNRYLYVLLSIIQISAIPYSIGQVKITFDFTRLFEDKKFTVVHREVKLEKYGAKDCLVLNEAVDEGLVWIDGVSFSTGTIDIDLKGQDVFQHSFLGIAFHGSNDSSFEAIYFRPFQFRTEDSVRKKRGVQYVSLPENTWQVLREKHPGVFEKTVEPAPDPTNWFHAKFVVTDTEALVYVDHATTPCLQVKLIGKSKKGNLALYTADRSGGSFANLCITVN